MADFLKATSKRKIILSKLKKIFLTRCYANLLILILLVGLTIAATLYLARPQVSISFPSGAVLTDLEKENIKITLEDRCINEGIEKTLIDITCPKQEPCKQNNCPSLDCNKCPENVVKENVFLIRCPNGMIVNSSEDCVEDLPEIESDYFTTVNAITISIDNVEIEENNGVDTIKKISYTIINQGEVSIKPVIWIKLYEEYTFGVQESMGKKKYSHDNLLEKNDWIRVEQDANLWVEDLDETTIRLVLWDGLPDPDDEIGAVFTDLDNFE